MEHNANPNQQNKISGETPIGRAIFKNHFTLTTTLLQAKADPYVFDNKLVARPFFHAFAYGYTEIALHFVQTFNPEALEKDGPTLLNLSACYNYPKITMGLVEARVNPNIPNKQGNLPLAWAGYNNHIDIAKILLEAKADVDMPDESGHTALMKSAAMGQVEMTTIFLNAEYKDAKERVKYSNKALDLARSRGHAEVIKLIVGQTLNNEDKATLETDSAKRKPNFFYSLFSYLRENISQITSELPAL